MDDNANSVSPWSGSAQHANFRFLRSPPGARQRSERNGITVRLQNRAWCEEEKRVWGEEEKRVWSEEEKRVWGEEEKRVWGEEEKRVWGEEEMR
eukprot:gene23433-biopygen10341